MVYFAFEYTELPSTFEELQQFLKEHVVKYAIDYSNDRKYLEVNLDFNCLYSESVLRVTVHVASISSLLSTCDCRLVLFYNIETDQFEIPFNVTEKDKYLYYMKTLYELVWKIHSMGFPVSMLFGICRKLLHINEIHSYKNEQFIKALRKLHETGILEQFVRTLKGD